MHLRSIGNRWRRYLSTEQRRYLRIGCASGFWGDTAVSTPQLIQSKPNVDFIVYDFLSEITMSLLAAAKAKNPAMGFCPDFVNFHMSPHLEALKRRGIRVVSNAGGLNPQSCAAALRKLCEEKGVELNIATVTGDDMITQKNQFASYRSMETGQPVPNSLLTANAYLGGFPIAKALDSGADVVITGRCVDSALVLGPLISKYGWKEADIHQLALGSLAGHLVECGAQVTGGIFSDWEQIKDWDNIGFPIVEFDDGVKLHDEFVITKPEGTGGKVSVATVAEQLVYEIGDPQNYLLPDITVDFSDVRLKSLPDRPDAVLVRNARGKAPPPTLKVSGTYMTAYRCTAVCPILGPLADAKGMKTADAILKRCRNIFNILKLGDFQRTHIQVLGNESSFGLNAEMGRIRECVLWMAVEHKKRDALEIFAREIAPAGTGMAPGLTGIVGGRPKVSPVLRLCSFAVPRDSVMATIHMEGKTDITYTSPQSVADTAALPLLPEEPFEHLFLLEGSHKTRLGDVAFTRSGDKGDTANIGVIAREPGLYAYLKTHVTADLVARYFAHLFDNKADLQLVVRYELPGIYALNFVLPNVLGGGGVASLRPDPQGKGLGQMLSDLPLPGFYTERAD